MVEMTIEERVKFCDKKFLQLIAVLMRNDSASYTFIKRKELVPTLNAEFAKNNQIMIRELEIRVLRNRREVENINMKNEE